MRRILPLSLLALMLVGGVASADRDRHWGGRDRDRGGDRRDNRDRQDRRDHRDNRGGVVVRDHRDHHRGHRRAIVRHRVHHSNGHYVFGHGIRRAYVRPVIRHRYYDVRVRPVVFVENMEPVPGYVWVRGNWQWNNREWVWTPGYYAPDPRYSNYYEDGTYDLSATVSGGVSVGF